MSDQLPSSNELAKTLLGDLKSSKEIYEEFSKQFRALYLIAGKKSDEWEQYFSIKIPPDANSSTLRDISASLQGLYQEAAFLKIMAESRLYALKTANDKQFREAYTILVQEYKSAGMKLPAKDTLTILAEQKRGTQKDSIVHAEIEVAFWKGILDRLNNTRKIIENISLNLASEAKALHNQQIIEHIGKGKYDE